MIFRQLLKYSPSKIIASLLGIISYLIYVRMLNLEEFSAYMLNLTTLLILTGFFISWAPALLIRTYSIYSTKENKKHIRTYLLSSTLLSLVAWWAVEFFYFDSKYGYIYLLAGSLWLVVNSLYEYKIGCARVSSNAAMYTKLIFTRSLFGLLLSVAALHFFKMEGEAILLGFALAMIIGLIFFIPTLPNRSQNQSNSDKKSARSYIRFMLIPSVLINGFTILISSFDKYIIEHSLSMTLVGIYSANYDLAEKIMFFVNSIFILASSATAIRVFDDNGASKAMNYLSDVLALYLAIAFQVAATAIVFFLSFNDLFLSTDYYSGRYIFPIVILSSIAIGIMHRYSLILTMHHRMYTNLACSAVALLVNIVTAYYLVSIYGIYGAAFATLITYLTWLFVVRYVVRNEIIPKFPWGLLIKLILLAVLSFTVMWLIANYDIGSRLLSFFTSFFIGQFIFFAGVLIFARELLHRILNDQS